MTAFPTYGRCQIPALGVGTYELRGDECVNAVRCALQSGFRLLDTAASYRNEALVGEGIRQSGVPREELFVVVKVSPKSFRSPEAVTLSVRNSLRSLGVGWADLVLLHWPGGAGMKPDDAAGHSAARQRAYGALRALQQTGEVRWLGVSNFLPRHFKDIVQEGGASPEEAQQPGEDSPVVNQVELHPLCVQADVVAHAQQRGMVVQQYAPLGQGDARLLRHPRLKEVVEQHFPGFRCPDVLLMWGLSQGYSTIVRSKSAEHLAANHRAGRVFFAEELEGGLTAHQRDTLRALRSLMGVDREPDQHFCWDSSTIA